MTKIALLIGINYVNSDGELQGCINDINKTKKMLIDIYKYKEENIVCLTDDSVKKPTGKNIIDEIFNLIARSNKEEITDIWISFSGHGSYIRDRNGDEKDGRDECIIPIDYQENGVISDDQLNNLFGYFNEKINLIVVIDACHSGSLVDLPYRYIWGDKNVIENKNNKIKCKCIMISGCRDNQTSSDAYNVNNNMEYSGAMTSSLLNVLDKYEYTITCWRLLKEMRIFLKKKKFTQVPQISSTIKINNQLLFSCVKPKSFLN